jgi:hypothetical protein
MGTGIGALILAIIAIFLYFLPTIIAYNKQKKNAGAICALNILLGWTFFGWVASLVWSLTND